MEKSKNVRSFKCPMLFDIYELLTFEEILQHSNPDLLAEEILRVENNNDALGMLTHIQNEYYNSDKFIQTPDNDRLLTFAILYFRQNVPLKNINQYTLEPTIDIRNFDLFNRVVDKIFPYSKQPKLNVDTLRQIEKALSAPKSNRSQKKNELRIHLNFIYDADVLNYNITTLKTDKTYCLNEIKKIWNNASSLADPFVKKIEYKDNDMVNYYWENITNAIHSELSFKVSNFTLYGLATDSFENKYTSLVSLIDYLFYTDKSFAALVLNKTAKNWSQNKFRRNNKNKKSFQFLMDITLEEKIKELAIRKGLKKNALIEELINEEHAKLKKKPEL